MGREAPLDILHLAAHCRNVPVTFTLGPTLASASGPNRSHHRSGQQPRRPFLDLLAATRILVR